MKKTFKGLPMNLQLFAEEVTAEQPEVEVEETEVAEETDKPDADKIVEKLQKRLDSKTKAEKETKTQLEQALARIEELEKGGKKSVKEQSVEDKQAEALALKEQENAELQAENQQLTTKLAMLNKGVNNEALDDVAVLAERLVSDDVTIEQAIDQVLEKYPQFGAQTAEDKPSIVKDGNMKTVDTNTKDPFAAKLAKWNK